MAAATRLRSLIAARLNRLAPALALLLTFGCNDSPSEPRGEISFQVVTKTTLRPASGPQFREVVRDPARWAEVWRELWAHGQEPPRPGVDFRREMVVVATSALSCFGDVAIEQISADRGRLQVRMADATPGTLCLCFAPEYVFEVVRAPRVDGPAEFLVRPIPPTCPS